jgi:hypothetical protein
MNAGNASPQAPFLTSPRKHAVGGESLVFIFRGRKPAVKAACELLVREHPVGAHTCQFQLPTEECPLDIVERISRTAELSYEEERGILEARLSFRQPSSASLIKSCRRETYRAAGWSVLEIEVPPAILATLIGPSMNKTLLGLSLEYGVIIEVPSPVVLENVAPYVLIAGQRENVDAANDALQRAPHVESSVKISVEEEILNDLIGTPSQFIRLQTLCQERGCILVVRPNELEVVGGSEVQSVLKKLHTMLYEYQRVVVELDEESGIENDLLSVVKCLHLSAKIERSSSTRLIICGLRQPVERALECLSHLLLGRAWIKKVCWSLAVPNQVRDFVSGKKDGKLIKIMRETDVQICLAPMCGVEHLQVKLEGGSIICVLTALGLLRGELPAEVTFHIPESQHKRLIGHGGKVIQQVMKKHAVYVKFLNAAEANDACGSSQINTTVHLDNVIVRTPAKNGTVLETVREEILQMAEHEEIFCKSVEAERRSIKMSKQGILLLRKEARSSILKLLSEVDYGVSLKRGWFENDLAALKLSGPARRIEIVVKGLESPSFACLFATQQSSMLGPTSPTLTISSSRTAGSRFCNFDLFRHFNSVLFPPPLSPLMVPNMAEDTGMPSPPGAPGSGRTPRMARMHSPAQSEWGSSTLSWSSPGHSPHMARQPATLEEEMAAASRIMDDMFFGTEKHLKSPDMETSYRQPFFPRDSTIQVGPKGLNSQLDPVIPKRRGEQLTWDWAQRIFS